MALVCTLKAFLGMKIEPEVDRDFLLFLSCFFSNYFFQDLGKTRKSVGLNFEIENLLPKNGFYEL